jgi:hypothetical protein
MSARQQYADHLRDQYLVEQDKRIHAETELERVSEELGAYKLAHQAYQQQHYSCWRHFQAGFLCGLLTAALVGAAANLAYTTLFKGTP